MVVGQKDFDTATSNDAPNLCPSNGTASDGTTLTYPGRCAKTMDFPRFALSDGKRLFIADGGNDRVLIYNTIPTANAAAADAAPNAAAPISNNRRRPIRSPSVPMVMSEPAIRNP